jgi:phosphoadenosine phosphosulfate reductase
MPRAVGVTEDHARFLTKLITQVRFRGMLTAMASALLDTPVAIRPRATDVRSAAAALERAPAEDVVAWAVDRFGEGLVLASSFQDCVLLDIALGVAPALQVVFLDTQYHFPETLDYMDRVRRRYDMDLRIVRPRVGPDERWRFDLDGCCAVRKVEPLDRALSGRSAWMSGRRRADSDTRSDTPVVGFDERRGLVKVNPLAAWTDADVERYIVDHDLPVHPLASRGFASIGCWPCTRAVTPGEDTRAGRWEGTEKTECGLHL